MALRPGQKKCIETLDRAIVVAAGAGSGKTFTLTKRIVGALETGYVDDIGQICAITFTNKAAAELKSRVKAELRACGLVEQSLKVDDAWISTIHGMCARILRAHAVELDIDPCFKLATTSQERLFLAEAVDAVLVRAQAIARGAGVDDVESFEGDDADDAREAGEFSRDVAALFEEYPARANGSFARSTVESMLEHLVDRAAGSLKGADAFELQEHAIAPGDLAQTVLESMVGLYELAGEQNPGARRDEWLAKTEDALAGLREALAAGQVADASSALELMAPFKLSRGFGGKDFKEQVDACKLVLESCVMELRLAAALPHLRTLVVLAREVLQHFQDRKRLEGVLDNTDLLVCASRALQDHPAIAAAYADRFRLVMVDEFQDTDQMQVDMIKRIAGPDACRLCVVGDAQQSIYRFRGADVSVYRRHLESVRAQQEDSIIELADNFRSHADILSLVDRVFEQPSMFGGEFMSLTAGREEDAGGAAWDAGSPRVQLQLVTKAAYRGVLSHELVEEQARQLALRLAKLKDEGHAASEMAVLLGRMTNADVYAKALREHGLACVISGGSVFSQTPEAQMTLELARVAVNVADTEALWRVLAGPLFRVPDAELLALATTIDNDDDRPRQRSLDVGLQALQRVLGRTQRPESQQARGEEARAPEARTPAEEADAALFASASPQLANAVSVLQALQAGVGRSPLSRLLMRAFVDSGWASRLEQRGPEGLASAANVYKAIRMLEDIEASESVGPLGALRMLEATIEHAKEAPGALSTEGGDFVRIMTVHASKGLEFPIVALAEFPDKAGDSSCLLALGSGDRIYLSLDLNRSKKRLGGAVEDCKPESSLYPELLQDCDTEAELEKRAREARSAGQLRAAIYEHGRLGDAEEAKRLLYVALTRAKEALVVSMTGARSKDNPNGSPKGCLGHLVEAIASSDEAFPPGSGSYGFGGQAPATVEHTALERDEEGRGAAPDGEGTPAPTQCNDGAAAEERFFVPAPEPRVRAFRVPTIRAHEGIFSYSSIAEASHRGDVLDRLADRFFVSCDQPFDEAAAAASAPEPRFTLAERRSWEDRLAAQGEEDDGSWAYLGSDSRDADKATDFGTAFHRLAQQAVLAHQAGEPLAAPDAFRRERMLQTCRVDQSQQRRLDQALERWFESDQARAAASWYHLRPELPFFLPLEGAGFLEGEIDLLCLDQEATCALVVDYKTGGHAGEQEGELARKHVLQASCYALAVLSQGVQELEAVFVRVERGRADDPSQPQCVRYRFTQADLDVLSSAVSEAYQAMAAS